MRERTRGWPLVCGLALSAWACAGTEAPSYGGESHWLDACAYDSDCGGGSLRCVCGTCTRGCVDDKGCGERGDALCANAESPLLVRRCEGERLRASDGICIARCGGDGDCPSGTGCVSGACVPLLSTPDAALPDAMVPVPMPDASITVPDAGDPIRDRIDDLASVDASVSFDESVALPDFDETIQGGDEQLMGSWTEVDCDPNRRMCARFDIERGEDGTVTGAVTFDGRAIFMGLDPTAPVDPELAYPPGLTPMSTTVLRMTPQPGVRYRILDGRWDGTRLRFVWSPADLWREWCALQTPYPWTIGERTVYQCVPQDPELLAAIDPAKIALCRHSLDVAEVPDCDGPLELCACKPGSAIDCPLPHCRCDAQMCRAEARVYQWSADLVLEGERLIGRFSANGAGADFAAFEQVAP